MNRDEQGGAGWKFNGLRENTFWITPKSFCCNWDLYFNLQSNTLPDQINGFIPNSLINSWNFREWHISIIYVKFEMWSSPFMWIPILFSTVKLKLGRKFSQVMHRFNIWILKCRSGAEYISKFFPIHKRDGKLGFLKSLDCISKSSSIHWKVWKLRFLSLCLHIWSNGEGVLSVRWHVASERSQCMIKLAVFKKKMLIL